MSRSQRHALLCVAMSFLMLCGVGVQSASAQRYPPPPGGGMPPPPGGGGRQQGPSVELGIGGSLNLPLSDEETLDPGATIHGTLLCDLNRMLAFEADLGYWFLQAASDEGVDNEDPSLLTLTGGLRFNLNRNIHLDGGLGLYHFSEWDYIDNNFFLTNYDSQSNFGFYGGVGFDVKPFDIIVRLHESDFYFDDFTCLEVGLRIFFPVSDGGGPGGGGGGPRRRY